MGSLYARGERMKPSLHMFLLVLACVLFLLEGLGVPAPPRLQFLGWGLFLFAISTLITV